MSQPFERPTESIRPIAGPPDQLSLGSPRCLPTPNHRTSCPSVHLAAYQHRTTGPAVPRFTSVPTNTGPPDQLSLDSPRCIPTPDRRASCPSFLLGVYQHRTTGPPYQLSPPPFTSVPTSTRQEANRKAWRVRAQWHATRVPLDAVVRSNEWTDRRTNGQGEPEARCQSAVDGSSAHTAVVVTVAAAVSFRDRREIRSLGRQRRWMNSDGVGDDRDRTVGGSAGTRTAGFTSPYWCACCWYSPSSSDVRPISHSTLYSTRNVDGSH